MLTDTFHSRHPSPVRIKGKFVASDPGETRFLILYSDATGFSLDCLKPS